MVDRKKGILLILTSSLFFALTAATVKSLYDIPVFQKVFFRNFIGFFVALYMVKKHGKSLLGNNKVFLLLRSLLGVIGIILYFYAISKIPLADAVVLNKTSPLFVILFCYLFLNESITKHKIWAFVLV